MATIGGRLLHPRIHIGFAGLLMVTALVSFFLAGMSIWLTTFGSRIASVWLANGVLLAIGLRSRKMMRWPLLSAGFAGNLVANTMNGDALSIAVALAACNTVEVALVLLPFSRHWGRRHRFDRVAPMARFGMLAFFAALVSTGLAWAALSLLAPSAPTMTMLAHWFIADGLGILISTPMLLALSNPHRRTAGDRQRMEMIVFLLAVAGATTIVFSGMVPLPFLISPLLLFAGYRLRLSGAGLVVIVASAVAIGFTLFTEAPSPLRFGNGSDRIFLLQAFILTCVLTVLPVSALTAERDRQRRRADATTAPLTEANRLLSMAEQLAGIGHWRFETSTGMLTMSEEARRILALSSRTVTGKSALGLFDAADRRALIRCVAAARRKNGLTRCGTLATQQGKVRRTIQLSMQTDRGVDGAVAGLFGVISDITEKMAAEAKLTEAVSEAQAAVRAKADFLATMSHEIRTPMTGVLGMIELLRGGATPAEQNRYLEVLKNSANLLMTVLNDILDFSRLDGGKLHLEDVPFDLTEMVAMAVRLYGESATGKGLRLEFEPVQAEPGVRSPLGSIVVRGDPGRLQQALGNLISNAIKFTSAGSVRVRLSVARHPKGIRCELAVIDSGIGISQHDQEKLFAPFVQAEASTSRRFGGTGLGLTISRKVIEAMGGKLALRSQLGVGTIAEVVLTLPTATMPARAEGAVPAPEMVGADGEAIRPRRLDVLVAEDNPVNQMLLSAILRRQGHHPTCVGNGREAVAAAAARSYDCILMDMQMPEMDGPDATRAIRARGPNADTPIIAITADASPDRRAVYEEAGLTDFMTKPIDSAALGAKLTMIARPRRLAVVVGGAELRRIGGAKVEPPSNDGHATADARAPFDEVQLAQIREVLGDERLATLMRLFTSELEHRPAAIRSLAARGNLAGVQNQAHSLRGAASSIGGVLVGEAAALVERAAGTEQPLEPALKALDAAVAATLVAVERIAAEATTDRAVGA